jgi:hypothetical protein
VEDKTTTRGKKRRRLGEAAWREVVQRFEASGLAVAAFCQREGLSQSSLQRWSARLAQAQASGSSPRAAQHFVDLGAVAAAGDSPGRLELCLDLGGGVTLHLVRG